MNCSYTSFKIDRRYGVPQGYDPTKPLQLVGTYGSIGILIRSLCAKLVHNIESKDQVLSSLSRVGQMIGRPLVLSRNESGDLIYDKAQLESLTVLAAPPAEHLDFKKGHLTFEQYIKKDPTWDKPEFYQWGQTEAEVETQRKKMNEKRSEKRKARVGTSEDHFRAFFFPLSATSKNNISRITLEDMESTGFSGNEKTVKFLNSGKGLKIALSGGSSHNKTASKKFYGKDWKDYPRLKGDVVIIVTGDAPMELDEYLEVDEDFLNRYRVDKNITAPVPDKNSDPIKNLDTVLSKKQKTK